MAFYHLVPMHASCLSLELGEPCVVVEAFVLVLLCHVGAIVVDSSSTSDAIANGVILKDQDDSQKPCGIHTNHSSCGCCRD